MASWLKLSRACCVSCATLPVWFTKRLCRVWSRIPREQVDVRMLQWKAVLSIFLDVSELPLRDVPRMPHWRCGSGLAGGAFECLGFIHVIRWEKMGQPPVSCGRWFGCWNSWNDALEGRHLCEKKVFSSPIMKNQWSVSNAWWLFKHPISEWIWKVETGLVWLVGHSLG